MPTVYLSLWSAESEPAGQKIADQIQSFLEKDSVLIGDNGFIPQKIRDDLARCEVLIVVIAEEAESSSKFLMAEHVMSERIRFEVVTAINLDLMIIPLLIDDAQLPEKRNMPGILKHLLDCKSYRLRTVSWFEDMHHLLEEIQEELDFRKDVEKKLSQSAPHNFPIRDGLDKQLGEPPRLGLEFSGALEIQKVIDLETYNLEEARRKHDRNLEQKALSALGLIFTRLGQIQKAIQYFEEQLEIVREQDDSRKICELLANLGDAFAVSGNIERARNYYEEQLALGNTRGHLSHVGSSYNGLGFLHVKKNEILKAIKCYVKALEVYYEFKDHDKALELLVGIGLNYQKLGNLEKTCEYLEQALDTSRYIENRREEARLLADLAEVHAQRGNHGRVKVYLDQAEETLNVLNESWADSLKQRIIHLREASSRGNL